MEFFWLHSIGSPLRPLESRTEEDSTRFCSRLKSVVAIWSKIGRFMADSWMVDDFSCCCDGMVVVNVNPETMLYVKRLRTMVRAIDVEFDCFIVNKLLWCPSIAVFR